MLNVPSYPHVPCAFHVTQCRVGALAGPGEVVHQTLAGVGVDEGAAGPSSRLPGPPPMPAAGGPGSGAALAALAASGAILDKAQIAELAKFDKKAAKKAKKEAKKVWHITASHARTRHVTCSIQQDGRERSM